MIKFLIFYYVIVQSAHFIALLFGFVFGMKRVMLFVSPGLIDDAYTIMLFSAYIDFFIAVPLAIAFAVGALKGKAWIGVVGLVSLTTAFISALLYVYVLFIFQIWQPTLLNLIITIIFTPVILLAIIYPFQISKPESS